MNGILKVVPGMQGEEDQFQQIPPPPLHTLHPHPMHHALLLSIFRSPWPGMEVGGLRGCNGRGEEGKYHVRIQLNVCWDFKRHIEQRIGKTSLYWSYAGWTHQGWGESQMGTYHQILLLMFSMINSYLKRPYTHTVVVPLQTSVSHGP